jgi:hypothetical protein
MALSVRRRVGRGHHVAPRLGAMRRARTRVGQISERTLCGGARRRTVHRAEPVLSICYAHG